MDRVLAFGCHPDDIEFMAAGTLALLAERGYEIHCATMTGGELGHYQLDVQEMRRIRTGEAADAAKVLNGHYHYAGGYDLDVEFSSVYRKRAVRVMREVDPLIVLTHAPMDYLADHEQTSLLVRNAAYIASVPHYDCDVVTTPTKRFPYLYYWNAVNLTDIFGRPLPISTGVNITTVFSTKEEMLACHKSQREWLQFHNGYDSYMEIMREWTRKQGEQVGAEYGECFVQHRSQGHPHDNILKQILGDLVVDFR